MITSNSNNKIKQLIQWQNKSRERKKDDVFLVEGARMFLEAPPEWIKEVYVSEEFLKREAIGEQIKTRLMQVKERLKGMEYELVTEDVFKKISDTQTPQGILCVLKRPKHSLTEMLMEKAPLLMLLEDIQDPGNLGTIIRTGEGAGITGVIMSRDTVDIYNPKTIRATMGSIYRIPFIYVESLTEVMDRLREHGIHSYAAHLKGTDYYSNVDFREGTAFLIGNEGNGLKKETADQADGYLKIPMEGKVESLNAAIAASLFMYEAHRQRKGGIR